MKLYRDSALILLLAGALSPVQAATVRVPVANDLTSDGVRFRTRIFLTNPSDKARQVEAEFRSSIHATARATTSTFFVPADSSVALDEMMAANETGIATINAEPDIIVSTRLGSLAADGRSLSGTAMPMISEHEISDALTTVEVKGLARDGERTWTNLGITNLGAVDAQCTLEVLGSDEDTLVPLQSLIVTAGSHLKLDDLLGQLGVDKAQNAVAKVSCDQSFHAYAAVYTPANGDVRTVEPVQTSVLATLPIHFEALIGQVWTCTQQDQLKHWDIPMLPGLVFKNLHVQMDFTRGPWYSKMQDGMHELFWINRTKVWRGNNFGYANIRGPKKNCWYLSTNVGPGSPQSRGKKSKAFPTQGAAYHIDYVLATGQKKASVLIMDASGAVYDSVSFSVPLTKIDSIGNWMIEVPQTRGIGYEVPSWGWTFSNLVVDWEP